MISKVEKVICSNTIFCVIAVLTIIRSSEIISAQNSDIETLFQLINERLSYMEHVALYKERTNSPTEDIEREAVVLMDAVESANELGLFGPSIESFFKAQMSVAKAIQYRYRADWQSESPSFVPLNLQETIRPKLSQIGRSIVNKMAALYSNGEQINEEHRDLFHNSINIDNVSQQDRTRLFDSLLIIEAQK